MGQGARAWSWGIRGGILFKLAFESVDDKLSQCGGEARDADYGKANAIMMEDSSNLKVVDMTMPFQIND